MKFLRFIANLLLLIAKRIGDRLIGSLQSADTPELLDETPDPIVRIGPRVLSERDELRRAATAPGHTLTGNAYVANQLLCYALTPQERRPFLQLRGVPRPYVGWLKSLDDNNLAVLSKSSLESIWDHISGQNLIMGLTSYNGMPEQHWTRVALRLDAVAQNTDVVFPDAEPEPEPEPEPELALQSPAAQPA